MNSVFPYAACPTMQACPTIVAASAGASAASAAPIANALYSSTFDQLVFWTLGYGGWLGIGFIPFIWSFPTTVFNRLVLTGLAPPLCAMLLTGLFSSFFVFGNIVYSVGAVMVHPIFLQSCIGTVCLSVGGVSLFLTHRFLGDMPEKSAAEMGEESGTEDESGEESSGAEESGEESVKDESADDESGKESAEEDSGEEETSEAWREKADFEKLKNAPPLSDEQMCACRMCV